MAVDEGFVAVGAERRFSFGVGQGPAKAVNCLLVFGMEFQMDLVIMLHILPCLLLQVVRYLSCTGFVCFLSLGWASTEFLMNVIIN